MPAMMATQAALLQLAEASAAHAPMTAGEQLHIHDEYLLFFGEGDHADVNCVQRPRLAVLGLDATVRRIRRLAAERRCRALTWEVSSAAEPSNLAERLLALGLRDAQAPSAVIMGASAAVPAGPADVRVRQVSTLDDFKSHVSVTHAVFDALDRLPAELARIDSLGAYDRAETRFVRYNAVIEGQVVGAATATFTTTGVLIHSGSTLPEFRGRGVYRAMVAQRWQDAVARGTPALVTRAGAMSRPILAGLGFEALGEIRFLVDELAY